jgi:hypothetical protein
MIDFGGYCLWEGSQEAELRPQEADMGCRALVNGSDSCISAIIDWCFLGKSLVNAYTGTGCELIFTGFLAHFSKNDQFPWNFHRK